MATNVLRLGDLGWWLADPKDWHTLPSHWIHLRPDLSIRLQMCTYSFYVGAREGVVAEAFNSNQDLLWDDDYNQHCIPDLTVHGLTSIEQQAVHEGARVFAPQLPVWKDSPMRVEVHPHYSS